MISKKREISGMGLFRISTCLVHPLIRLALGVSAIIGTLTKVRRRYEVLGDESLMGSRPGNSSQATLGTLGSPAAT